LVKFDKRVQVRGLLHDILHTSNIPKYINNI
jgi:hypothetical protein